MAKLISNLNKYSRVITQPKERGAAQAMLYALGLTKQDMKKPQVGVCSMWYQGNPCNCNLNFLSDSISKSISKEDMLAMQFNTIGISDGISMGTEGMKYSLPSRDLISDSIESVVKGMHYDALVCIPGCDKNLPGSVMAMIQLNRPSLMVYGGSMKPSEPDKYDIVSAFESYGQYLSGEITDEERQKIVSSACNKGCGSCSGFYTANTMASLFEVMGISLPNSSSNMNMSRSKLLETDEIGSAIKNLLIQDIKPKDILTKQAFKNAITMLYAIGGSTNAVIHLLAIAQVGGIELTLDDFSELENVPVLLNMKPHGKYVMDDLDKLGGTSIVIKYLIDLDLIDGSLITVTGKTLEENVAHIDTKDYINENKDIILPVEFPFKDESHITILKGNLAVDGCISKISSKDKFFEAPLIVFDSEEEMLEALKEDKIKRKDMILLRYQGESIGCPEMLTPTSALIGYFGENPPILATDGRFSGGSHGILIANLPDAYKPDNLTRILKNGDKVQIDLTNNKIDVMLDHQVIQQRLNNTPVKKLNQDGYLNKFKKLVGNIETGYCTY
tara:strand:+ start:67 stop:1743 length:1677 start_codon:yes stop_codon:yes gene_type:complete